MTVLNQLTIPPNIMFTDLYLYKNYKHEVCYNQYVYQRVCEASGIHINTQDISLNPIAIDVIATWYHQHLAHGGSVDPIAEEIIRLQAEH